MRYCGLQLTPEFPKFLVPVAGPSVLSYVARDAFLLLDEVGDIEPIP